LPDQTRTQAVKWPTKYELGWAEGLLFGEEQKEENSEGRHPFLKKGAQKMPTLFSGPGGKVLVSPEDPPESIVSAIWSNVKASTRLNYLIPY